MNKTITHAAYVLSVTLVLLNTPYAQAMDEKEHTLGFASQFKEVEHVALEVRGEMPGWVRGTLLRNGPAQFEPQEGSQVSVRHWFDGLAMLHGFEITGDGVRYTNKALECKAKKDAREHGGFTHSGFANDPCRELYARVQAQFTEAELKNPNNKHSNNANVNVAKVGDRLMAFTETPLPVEFDAETLATVGVAVYEDDIKGELTTAHQHEDGRESLNYITRFGMPSMYTVYRRPTDGLTREIVAEVEATMPAYMHSFGLTERDVVLSEPPFRVNPMALLKPGKPFIDNFEWDSSNPALFHLVDRNTGEVSGPHPTDPFFFFHHANAYEEDEDTVVADICVYNDASIVEATRLQEIRDDLLSKYTPQLKRFRINKKTSEVSSELVSETVLEFPRINYAFNGKKYEHVYGVGEGFASLKKVDVETGNVAIWAEKNCYPGEPVFVASPEAATEDDGVLLSVVLDSAQQNSFLLVLDACTMQEIARADAPHHIPFGLHGDFFADSEA